MDQVFPMLGVWVWFVAAGLLMLLELFSPGVFLLWLGVAAGLTGLAGVFLPMPWQAELLLFAVLSALTVFAGRRVYRGRPMQPADNPYLNRRQMSYVGRSFTLREPLSGGRGKLTIEDTVWDIEGPDLPAGAGVKVISVRNMSLVVEPAG
jgi:membrane protein implicated in regulation of membrane protease activity